MVSDDEVNEQADPRTKASLRFCYERESRRGRGAQADMAAIAPGQADSLTSRNSRRPSPAGLDAPTEISTDVFDQRSQTLRKSVRQARGGGPPRG